MKQSQLFSKTRKEAPKDEVSKNAQLLIRAGFIHKEMAGVYAFLPLGLRVIENIKNIIREEMNGIRGQELIMTSLQRKELWEKTDRWDDEKVDVWFKSALKNGTEVGFGWSHEEQITEMMTNYISSYRDLPTYVYQFQGKLRNETRAKSGIMRCREFVMKDMYSYCRSEEDHKAFYDDTTAAYLRVFEKVGLGDRTFFTFASGGAFTQFSHEFQTITDAGEDIIYIHREKKLAINQEVLTDEVMVLLGVKREELEEAKAAEVGNIFSFGGAKSEQLGLFFKDENGISQPVILGSYGIGVTRLMGVIVECFADDGGIVWPEAVAPFKVHLLSLGKDEESEKIYQQLTAAGVEVLFDDRDMGAGAKLADSDLMGMPYRVVVGKKSLEQGGAEVKGRTEETGVIMTVEALLEKVK
ncbi:MAG: His/Gly/Thr/Pro-type tRNA ligase C-terminal domain-containing protein [Candidatus Moranbacteria bacterium]|nr:His/Gly/Thr/Pro-type tRNA ligase C-terminal domain-containing protein [Candidatus Moranbacteria bacterium]